MEIGSLVRQYQQGDTDAFAQVYVESCQPLFVYAKYLEKDNDKAEDLLQDTYIEIMKSVDSLQHPEAFMTWSKTIMSRLYKKQFSGKGSLESTIKDEEQAASLFDQIEDTDQTFMPAENLDEKALKEFVLEQVNDLPDQQRLAMFSFYYDKLPIIEIAGIMDVSENTVKAHLYQGRAAVKQKIEAYEEKHGIRMHSILPTPFLYELFKGIGDATANSLSTDFALKIYQGVAAKVAATGQALGANAVQTGMEAVGKLGEGAVQAAQNGQVIGTQAVDAGAGAASDISAGTAADTGAKVAMGKTAVGSGTAATAGAASGVRAKVIAQMRCMNCGQEIADDSTFCRYCGANQKKATEMNGMPEGQPAQVVKTAAVADAAGAAVTKAINGASGAAAGVVSKVGKKRAIAIAAGAVCLILVLVIALAVSHDPIEGDWYDPVSGEVIMSFHDGVCDYDGTWDYVWDAKTSKVTVFFSYDTDTITYSPEGGGLLYDGSYPFACKNPQKAIKYIMENYE